MTDHAHARIWSSYLGDQCCLASMADFLIWGVQEALDQVLQEVCLASGTPINGSRFWLSVLIIQTAQPNGIMITGNRRGNWLDWSMKLQPWVRSFQQACTHQKEKSILGQITILHALLACIPNPPVPIIGKVIR